MCITHLVGGDWFSLLYLIPFFVDVFVLCTADFYLDEVC